MIVEKVFFTKSRKLAEDEMLKRVGFRYEHARTLGLDKDGWYFLIKAEEEFFEKCEALKEAEEIKGEEKEDIIRRFRELDERLAGGIGAIF